jgi:hypothetical protein
MDKFTLGKVVLGTAQEDIDRVGSQYNEERARVKLGAAAQFEKRAAKSSGRYAWPQHGSQAARIIRSLYLKPQSMRAHIAVAIGLAPKKVSMVLTECKLREVVTAVRQHGASHFTLTQKGLQLYHDLYPEGPGDAPEIKELEMKIALLEQRIKELENK